MELAINTSTQTTSVALSSESMVVAELTRNVGQKHAAQQVPNLIHDATMISKGW